MNIDKTKPVLVTGGSGYIASWLVKYLLEEGYNVRATVRDPNNDKKVGHLKRLAEKTPGRLTLFQADLLSPGAFNGPMKGCEVVFHTASPFVFIGIKDPQKQLIDPAVQGTRNVLDAANRNDSVKRVVLTSSVAAVHGDNADAALAENGVLTEKHWNTTSSIDHQPYNYSKVAAEKAAWEIAGKQDRWDLVVINPAFVLGPSLTQGSDSTSLSTMLQFTDGTFKFGAPDLSYGVVDVRDVAQAHIKAAFTPTAKGRHILSSEVLSFVDMGRILRKHFGNKYPFPRGKAPKPLIWLIAPFNGLTRKFVARNVGHVLKLDNSYAKQDLGMTFRPAAETLVAHFQQMIDDKIIPDKR
jgi:nucleoside-diphosphate-sugar epimerase